MGVDGPEHPGAGNRLQPLEQGPGAQPFLLHDQVGGKTLLGKGGVQVEKPWPGAQAEHLVTQLPEGGVQ
ncbi:MAG: hypothetical protein ACOC15_03140 [Desulfovibrionales bacterium]